MCILQSTAHVIKRISDTQGCLQVNLSLWPEYTDPLGIKPQHLQKLSKFFKDAEEATFDEVSR